MTADQLFDRARRLAAQQGISQSQALSILARRSAEVRRRKLGVLPVKMADRRAFANVESPRAYWWDRD